MICIVYVNDTHRTTHTTLPPSRTQPPSAGPPCGAGVSRRPRLHAPLVARPRGRPGRARRRPRSSNPIEHRAVTAISKDMRHAPIESNDTPHRTVHCDMCVSPEPPHAPRTGRVHKENAPPSNNTMRSGADRSTQTHSQHKMHIVYMSIVKSSPRWCLVMRARCQAHLGRAHAYVPVSALPEWPPLSYLAMCP